MSRLQSLTSCLPDTEPQRKRKTLNARAMPYNDESDASWFVDQWLQGTTSPSHDCEPISRRRRREHSDDMFVSPTKRRRIDNSAVEDALSTSESSPTKPGITRSPRSRASSHGNKTTVALTSLEKPVRFVAMEENPIAQLPGDVWGLYRRIRDIVDHKAFMPLSIRGDILSVAGTRYQASSSFYHDAGMSEESARLLVSEDARDAEVIIDHNDDEEKDDEKPPGPSYLERRQQRQPTPRAAALAELDTIVDLVAVATNCQALSRHEATWNIEVHYPLFRLALNQPDCAHVLVEPVTHASIAPAFLPPWKHAGEWTQAPGETVDSTAIGFVMVLFMDPDIPR